MEKKIEPKDVSEVFTFYRNENGGKEPTEWHQVTIFDSQGYGIISVDGYSGVINRNGEIIIPLIYDNIIDFAELNSKLVLACMNDFWGYINWKNEIIIPFEYSYASVFQNGKAKVCKDGRYYIINENNEVLEEIDGLEKTF